MTLFKSVILLYFVESRMCDKDVKMWSTKLDEMDKDALKDLLTNPVKYGLKNTIFTALFLEEMKPHNSISISQL